MLQEGRTRSKTPCIQFLDNKYQEAENRPKNISRNRQRTTRCGRTTATETIKKSTHAEQRKQASCCAQHQHSSFGSHVAVSLLQPSVAISPRHARPTPHRRSYCPPPPLLQAPASSVISGTSPLPCPRVFSPLPPVYLGPTWMVEGGHDDEEEVHQHDRRANGGGG